MDEDKEKDKFKNKVKSENNLSCSDDYDLRE